MVLDLGWRERVDLGGGFEEVLISVFVGAT
jgi:hypothetical protein